MQESHLLHDNVGDVVVVDDAIQSITVKYKMRVESRLINLQKIAYTIIMAQKGIPNSTRPKRKPMI